MEYGEIACFYLVIFNLVVATIFTGLRCYVRGVMVKKFWLDDWLAVITLFAEAGLCAPIIHGFKTSGFHNHFSIDPITYRIGLIDLFLSIVAYILSFGLIKVSFCFTLLRFMVETWQIVATQILVAVITAAIIAFVFVTVHICSPVSYFWNRVLDPYQIARFIGIQDYESYGKPKGHCKPNGSYSVPLMYSQVSIMIVIDVILGLVMPYLMLRNITMRRDLKIAAFSLLALGAIPSIASIIRLYYVHTIDTLNVLDNARGLIAWSTIELTCCIMGTALTTFKPLARKFGFFKEPTLYKSNPGNEGPRFGPQRRKRQTDTSETIDGATATVWGFDASRSIGRVGKATACQFEYVGQPDFANGIKD